MSGSCSRYSKSSYIVDDVSFSTSTVKSLLRGPDLPVPHTERPPGEDAGSEGWLGLGTTSGGALYVDFPGDSNASVFGRDWRWFTIEKCNPRPNRFGGLPYVRIQALSRDFEMFSLLAYFLLTNSAAAVVSGKSSAAAAAEALTKWEQYLGSRVIDDENMYVGVFGELYVLCRLITEMGPDIVSGWGGPYGAPQDFVVGLDIGRVGLEVKTIGALADSVTINGTEQLSAPGALVAVRVGHGDVSYYTGSVADLVASVRKQIKANPDATSAFEDRLSRLNLNQEDDNYVAPHCITRIESWNMQDLPVLSVHGPGKESLRPIRATLRLSQGRLMKQSESITGVFAGISLLEHNGEAV